MDMANSCRRNGISVGCKGDTGIAAQGHQEVPIQSALQQHAVETAQHNN